MRLRRRGICFAAPFLLSASVLCSIALVLSFSGDSAARSMGLVLWLSGVFVCFVGHFGTRHIRKMN